MVPQRRLVDSIFSRTFYRRDCSYFVVSLYIQHHFDRLESTDIILQHICSGREIWLQQTDRPTMDYRYDQRPNPWRGSWRSVDKWVLGYSAEDWKQFLLLPVALLRGRPIVCNHHLPDRDLTPIQQTLASPGGSSKDGSGSVGRKVKLSLERALCD